MRRVRRFRVGWAVPRIALVGALLVLIAGISMAIYEEHLYQLQRFGEAQEQADILAATETAALSFKDRNAAQEYVESLRVNPEIEAVAVYTRNGAWIAGFVRDRAAPFPARLGAQQHRPQDGSLVVTASVIQDKAILGSVYLRATVEPAENRFLRQGVLALLVIMALLVIGGLGNAQIRLQRQAERLAHANTRLQIEMTERAKAEEALRQSQKMEAIGQLSGAIAHDFNNLLTIIKGNMHLLRRRTAALKDDRHLDAAMEGVTRAAALTQRILAFSRKQTLSPAALQLDELILDMTDLIRNSLREDIDVVKDLRARWWVTLDRNQMENVILNIVINARDAMPNGGRLVLRTEDLQLGSAPGNAEHIPPGLYVKLTVEDTGTGMSDEVRNKALDPFFTTKPVGQGTGLGLSTTLGFIGQSGGYLHIESTPGSGTAIGIYLPRAVEAAGTERT